MKLIVFMKGNRLNRYILIFLAALVLITGLAYRTYIIQQDSLRTKQLKEVRLSTAGYPYYSHTLSSEDIDSLTMKNAYRHTRDIRRQQIPPSGLYKIEFIYVDKSTETIQYSRLLNKYYDGRSILIEPSEAFEAQLQELINILDRNIYDTYGELIPWEEADKIFPLFSFARIIDIYSGASFMVQRRAGSSHADAQPLTSEDTAIMKEIFHGSWTWERSGIIVEVNGRRIAASMNGKPHGAGKIKDNNFPGHFCIHFLNSTTHSGNVDKRHLEEILKAAGKLPLDYTTSFPSDDTY
ncbi:MAG TPA: hypothetical protein GX505_11915 [Clostridiales bacterium]|nr:hypothetical protein [Clostridiales bacterium]